MLGTMSVLADAGITSGVMSEGGKVWQNSRSLGQVLATGIALRKRSAIYCIAVIVPILIYMLHSHGASWLQIAGILVGVILTFITGLTGTLFQIIPKLHQHLLLLSKVQTLQALGRLLLIAPAVKLFPFSSIAIIAAALPQLWANFKLKKVSEQFAERDCAQSPKVKKNILRIVRRTLPGSIFYCISGQITVFLIAIFGSTTSIAEIGALGRISQLSTVYSVIIASIVVPRFARLQADPKLLAQWLIAVFGVTVIFGSGVISFTALFSEPVLWLLGSSYSGLKVELLLSLGSSAVSLLSGSLYTLGHSRGWVMNPILMIPLTVIGQAIWLPFLDLSITKGVLTIGLLGGVIPLISQVIYMVFVIRKMQVS